MASVEDLTSRTRSAVADVAGAASQDVQDVAERAKDIANQAVDKMSEVVRKYPYQSVLAGLGIGAVIGYWLRRK